MKIILSRKGFDSSAGRVPNPILPDGTLLSFPIPDTSQTSKIRYEDIRVNGESIGKIVEDLTNHKITRRHFAHLDPDLNTSAYRRSAGWRPLFGPGGPAQTHLQTNGVAVGDLFLFFGWFRQTEIVAGKYGFVKSAPDRHIIFGWLQVGAIVSREKDVLLSWAKYHHHFQDPDLPPVVYISRATLDLDGVNRNVTGGGAFEKYQKELCLTCSNQPKRSVWKLPQWFYPFYRHARGERRPPLSHHRDRRRWKLEKGHAILQSVGRGQEFVLEAEKYPQAITWVRDLIALEKRRR